jgi:hypothetical protein
MIRRGRNSITCDQDYVVCAVELPTSISGTTPLPGLVCQAVLHSRDYSSWSPSFSGFNAIFREFCTKDKNYKLLIII